MTKNRRLPNKTSLNAGFTLVELLVVIAIIGILSGVVLASLNVARSRGADARTKAQLANARASAEIYFEANNSYNGIAGDIVSDCATVDSMFQDVDSGMVQYTDPANYKVPPDLRCSSLDDAFAISAALSTPGEFWCVDSTGMSVQLSAADHITAHPDSDTTCN